MEGCLEVERCWIDCDVPFFALEGVDLVVADLGGDGFEVLGLEVRVCRFVEGWREGGWCAFFIEWGDRC